MDHLGASRFSIGRFSVEHPVLVNILMFTLIALGVFSIARLPQEQFAEVPFYWVNIIVPYPGVSAEDLETSVTVPIENQFQGINKLKRISSTTSEGLSVVRVEFDDGITDDEFRSLYQEAQTRFNRVSLPEGALEPVIDDFSSADFLPVVEVILSGNASYQELRRQAQLLRDQLLRVRDVRDVDIVGLPELQIVLDADPYRMAALGLTPAEILRAVQDQNVTIPGGTLTASTREYLLRTFGSVRSIEDFGNVIIRRSDETGGVLQVSDVAEVFQGIDPSAPTSRYNGQQAVSLRVTKIPRGSSVSVVSGTRAAAADFEQQLPLGMSISLFNDSTVQIASSLNVLTTNALIGLMLLVVMLWLFIGLRNALITAVGVPITFALTFVILDLTGETINTNTLFALVLVLGLIVDHAIVIIENSYRLRQQGLSRRDAAILGTNQVVLPVIAATATTIAAFLPLMLIPGTIGKFLRVIPFTAAIALLASTGEAMFFLPSHFADWGKDRTRKRPPGWWFKVFRKRYERLLKRLYLHKKKVLLSMLIIMVGTFSLAGTLRQDLFSAEDFSYFTIDITMPTGTPLARTDQVVAEYEDILLSLRGEEIVAIRSSIGTASGGTGSTTNANIAQIVVDLKEQDEGRTRGIDEIIDEVRWQTYYVAGPDQVLFRKAQNGPPTSPPISYRISGDSFEQLVGASRDIQGILAGFEGVFNIVDDYTAGSPELQVVINQERASSLGVDPSLAGNYIRARFDGIPVGTFFSDNQELDVVLRYDSSGVRDYDQLEQALIPLPDGRLVPLSSIAEIHETASLGNIRRVDGKREITITADAVESLDLREVDRQVLDAWNGEISGRYGQTELLVGGEFSEFQDLLIDILRIFTFGVFLIYLILGTQFNSYRQPFLILLAVPFAFVGVVLYLFISGTPLSTTVIYAGVALAGIAVNDAIVLISFINEQRKKGGEVRSAVLKGAATRLRPIILTSLTTIMGLLPTAIGIGGTSVVWGPMASTIIFGLLFSTITTLVVIPLLYGLIFDRKGKASRPLAAAPVGAVLLLALLVPASLEADESFSPGYPDLMCCETAARMAAGRTAPVELRQFFDEWVSDPQYLRGETLTGRSEFMAGLLASGNPAVGQLERISRMQQIMLSDLQSRRYPTLSIRSDAQNPLYRYGVNVQPPGSTTKIDEQHILGIGLGLTQQLPTAGSLRFSASHQSVVDNGDWSHRPVLSVSLDQPVFSGPGVIRTDHMSRELELQELSLQGALDAGDSLSDQLLLQGLQLLHLRQSLLEQRWVADGLAVLLEEELEQAQSDLQRGQISRSEYRRKLLQRDQQLFVISELNQELLIVEASLKELYGPELLYPGMLVLPHERVLDAVERFSRGALGDNARFQSAFRDADRNVREAQRELQRARLERLGGVPGAAPRLGLSLQLEGDDYASLFSADSPFSVAVSLQIPDLFRRDVRLADDLGNQQIEAARLQLEQELRRVDRIIQEYQGRIDSQLFSLSVLLEEYAFFAQDREEEERRFASGLSDRFSLGRMEISQREAAFRVLQVLREFELLDLELMMLTGG